MDNMDNAATQVMPSVTTPPPVYRELQSVESVPSALKASKSATSTQKKPPKGLIIALSVAIGLLLLAAGTSFAIGRYYLANRAPLGTNFAGQSVAGKTVDELTELVNSKASGTKFVIGSTEGKSIEAGYSDLGIKVDVEKTIANLLDAKGSNPFSKVNFLQSNDVPLAVVTDTAVLQEYLDQKLIDDEVQVVLPTVTYDVQKNAFIANEGKDGEVVSPKTVKQAVTTSLTQAPATTKVSVTLQKKAAPIAYSVAQTAAEDATQRLSLKLVVGNGSAKKYTIPAAKIGEWTKAQPDTDKGTMSLSYDTDAIENDLNAMLPNELNQAQVEEDKLVTPTGRVLQVKTAGVDGVTVKDVSEAITAIQDGLAKGTAVTTQVKADVSKHGSKTTQVPSNFGVPNGDPWIEVNLSTQKVNAYRGTTQVRSFNTATGLATPARRSDNGTFYVYLKYNVQTMRGADYVTPNVPWVTYYNGGEAFHGARWNTTNIALGKATSHGCINMNVDDAKWIYDFAPIGTKVEVVGTTPSGPVRAVSAE